MSSSELNFLSATALAEKIQQKEISPVEALEAHLARIAQLNPKLNAFVEVNGEEARRQAQLCENALAHKKPLGPLHGIPISIKSSISVAGMRCEAGSNLRKGFVAKADAPLVTRLKNAGAIVVGTTNTPELLMAWETDNSLYGRTNNPWDITRTAGGSSGGEAAAIAAGCSVAGVGSDGGGSIRVPAHFTGICGLKPTPGRIPATGHYPVSAGPFALLGVVGPMARSVADLKVMFEVMQGPDIGDPSAVPLPVHWPKEQELKKNRIGYLEDDGRTPVTPETRVAVQSAVQALRHAGFEVEPFRPKGLDEARELWWKIFGRIGRMLLEPMTAGRKDVSPLLQQFLSWTLTEPEHTADSLLETWIQRDLVRMRVFAQMSDFPVLLCPAAAVPAFLHGERSWNVDGKTVSYLDAWSYTEWFNLLGMPAVVVPMSMAPANGAAQGLPIGVQISAMPWQEELVLSVASALEQERGDWQPPEIS